MQYPRSPFYAVGLLCIFAIYLQVLKQPCAECGDLDEPCCKGKGVEPCMGDLECKRGVCKEPLAVPPPFGVAPTYGIPPTTVPTPAPAVEPIYPGVVPAPVYGMPPPAVVPPPPAYGGFPAMPPPFAGMHRALLTGLPSNQQSVTWTCVSYVRINMVVIRPP